MGLVAVAMRLLPKLDVRRQKAPRSVAEASKSALSRGANPEESCTSLMRLRCNSLNAVRPKATTAMGLEPLQLIVFASLALFPITATADGRKLCSEVIEQAGFQAEAPYSYEEPGFFTWEQHKFGIFRCTLNTDGTIAKVTRGDNLIAEDGFVGVDALELRALAIKSQRILNAKHKKKRDDTIEAADREYEISMENVDSLLSNLLVQIKSGTIDENTLTKMEIDKSGAVVRSALAKQSDSASESSTSMEKFRIEREETEKRNKLRAAAIRREQISSNLKSRNFAQLVRMVGISRSAGDYTRDELKELEESIYKIVKSIPARDVDANRDGYALLVSISPINQTYIDSLTKYSDISSNQKLKTKQALGVKNSKEEGDRFNWIATRLHDNNSEAQRELAFESVEGKSVVAVGRVTDVERGGIFLGPTVTLASKHRDVDVSCSLARGTRDSVLVSIRVGSQFECRGKLSHYVFVFGSALIIIEPE